jgi:hypothetical protein
MQVAMTATTTTNAKSSPRARGVIGAKMLSPAAAPKRAVSPSIRSYANECEESPARPIAARIAAVPISTRDRPSTEAIARRYTR